MAKRIIIALLGFCVTCLAQNFHPGFNGSGNFHGHVVTASTQTQIGQTYSAGTVFQENFGNTTTGGEACYSGGTGIAAQCAQLWSVTAGSGQTVVAAPTGYNFTGTNVLELPSGATALSLQTSGTFPVIPANSGFTITMTVAVSAYDSGYVGLFKLQDGVGNTEVSFGEHSTGFFEGGGNPCTASAAAVHTLKVVMNGASSTFSIDGTQCGSAFADPGYAPFEAFVTGSTGANVYIQSITINGSTVTGGWPPSAFMDWAGGSGSATTTNLAGGTHCGNGAWTISSLTGVTFSFTSDGQTFLSPEKVCGTNYTNNTNVALEMAVTTTSGSSGSVKYGLGTVYGPATVGLWVKYNVQSTADSYYTDIIQVQQTNGYGNNLQIQNSTNGHLAFCVENVAGSTQVDCTTMIPAQNTWYWLTFGIGPSNPGLKVYSTSGALLESVACTGCTAIAGPALRLNVGKTGSETNTGTMNVFYSGIVFDYADAAYPLLPPS